MTWNRTLAALGLIALAQLWAAPAQAACHLDTLAVLPVTMQGMRPTVPVKVNGHDAQFLLDSGAFFSALSPESARRFGLKSASLHGLETQGVGGDVETKAATLDTLTLAGVPLRHFDIAVIEGAGEGILGRSTLAKFDVEYDLANGVVRFFRTEHCGRNDTMTYWTKGAYNEVDMLASSVVNKPIIGSGAINGQRIRMVFDTGAGYSIATLRAAGRAKITPQSPGAVYAGKTRGIGDRLIDTWIAPVDSFAIGDEQVQHTRLRIGAIELDEADMLLGADFFLSHRIFVSNSQRKLYFTYNGGSVFNLDRTTASQAGAAQASPAAPAAPASPDGPADLNGPVDAPGFARRAAAEVSRLQYAAAIADFTRAIALDPTTAQTFLDRGGAYRANRQPVLALADLDQALKLKPDDVSALLARASLLMARDKTRAGADLVAAAKASTDPEQSLMIARSFEGADLQSEGIEQLDRWLAANPKAEPALRAVALNDRCWLRAELHRDLNQALLDCDTALKLTPRNPAFLNSRGHVQLDRGQYDLAIADYDAALRENPKLAASLYGRGVAKLKKGVQREGEADLKAALALNPRLGQQAAAMGLPAPGELGLAAPSALAGQPEPADAPQS